MRYPDINDEKLGVMKDFGESNKTLVSMWERVKAADDGMGTIVTIIIILVSIIALSLLGVIIIKRINTPKKRIVR